MIQYEVYRGGEMVGVVKTDNPADIAGILGYGLTAKSGAAVREGYGKAEPLFTPAHPREDTGATAIASPDNPLQMVSRNIEIQKLSRQGLSNRHIGRRFGISGARVKQILDAGGGSTAPVAADPRRLKRRRWSAKAHKRAALRRQSRQKATPELMEEMLALREQGYMIKELCEAYHYSSAQVDRLLKRAAAARSAVATEVAT